MAAPAVLLKGPCLVLEIEGRLAACKASILPTVPSLWPPNWVFFKVLNYVCLMQIFYEIYII